MENFNGTVGTLSDLALSLPFNYLLLIAGIMALATIWGKAKMGLLAASVTFFILVFKTNSALLMEIFKGSSTGMLAALSIALTMSILVIVVLKDQSQ